MAYNDFKTEMLAVALASFRKRATLASALRPYTDISGAANAASEGDTIRFTRVNKFAAPTAIALQTAGSAPSVSNVARASTHKFNLVLNNHRKVYWDVDDADDYNTGGRIYAPVVASAASRLADYIEADMFDEMGVGGGGITGGTSKAAFDGGIANIIDARAALSRRDALTENMFMFVSPGAAANLLGEDAFTSVADRGGDAEFTGRTGYLGRKFGFTFMESNNLPSYTRKQSDLYDSKGSGNTAGSLTVAVDKTGKTGFNRGEAVQIAGKWYIVRDAVTGADITLNLNRPLEDNFADNAAMGGRWNGRLSNFAMSPQSLAFAMRPTAPPINATAGTFGSLTDSETGFSLTLEQSRHENMTRYEISALWGVRVIQPEMIEQVSGATDDS